MSMLDVHAWNAQRMRNAEKLAAKYSDGRTGYGKPIRDIALRDAQRYRQNCQTIEAQTGLTAG